MERKIIVLLVIFLTILGCEKEPLVVLPPELYVEVSSKELKFGEDFTISWQSKNVSYISTNFIYTKDLNGSYSEKLTESKVFWIQAFNSEGISIIRKVSVTVEPNELDPVSILLKYKWTMVASDRDLGENEDGSHSWLPYNIIPDMQFVFFADGSRKVLNSYGTVIGEGKYYTWSLDKDKKVLILNGKEHKVLFLSKEKMELYTFVSPYYFKDTYRADPKE